MSASRLRVQSMASVRVIPGAEYPRLFASASAQTVIAPWWQWVPIDFVAELFPLTDHHDLCFTLHPPGELEQNPELLVRRGEELRDLREGFEVPAHGAEQMHGGVWPAKVVRHGKPIDSQNTTARVFG